MNHNNLNETSAQLITIDFLKNNYIHVDLTIQ